MSIIWTIAIESLSWIELKRLNEDAAIRKTVKQLNVHDKEKVDEAKHLVYETMRRLNAIDYLVNEALTPSNLGKLKIGLRSFLRLFTYLIHYSDRSLAEAYELVNHTMAILKKREYKPVRNIPDLIPLMRIPLGDATDAQRLAYNYFHPIWYVEKLFNEYGARRTEKLLEYVDYPNYLRLNTLKSNADSIDKLYEQGFQLVKEPEINDCYRLLDDDGLTDTKEYRQGHFIIQDKASILAGIIADPKPDDILLDVCAAPGVKTSHYAQQMKNTGRIISIDYSERRLESWKSLMDQLGVENAKLMLADATKLEQLPNIEADIVVVDPPCTGSGLFHKNPSSKWRITPRSAKNMAKLQKQILWNSSRKLREEGSLVYSTCSISIEENEEVVQTLLDRDSSFTLVNTSPRIGEPGLRGLDLAQRLYPHSHLSNGFFIAKLVKNK